MRPRKLKLKNKIKYIRELITRIFLRSNLIPNIFLLHRNINMKMRYDK